MHCSFHTSVQDPLEAFLFNEREFQVFMGYPGGNEETRAHFLVLVFDKNDWAGGPRSSKLPLLILYVSTCVPADIQW